jgi:hypothetical protein
LSSDVPHASEAQKALIRCASLLITTLEQREAIIVQQGEATDVQLETYQRAANSLKRLLEAISPGLERTAKHVGPTLDDIKRRYAEAAE